MIKNTRILIKNSLSPRYTRTILEKILKRAEKKSHIEAIEWAKSQAQSFEDYCSNQDGPLWEEVLKDCDLLKKDAQLFLEKLDIRMGGGGAYPLLNFLIRKHRPDIAVETGVAAGWSSRSILEAMEKNGKGKLYSSDFPYFRLDNPEQYIGCIVPDKLRDKWHLDIRGDRIALPSIVSLVNKVDFFHFDSDKSYSGRAFAYENVKKRFHDSTIILIDDIQDNTFFKDLVENGSKQFCVFEFEEKYIGALGI